MSLEQRIALKENQWMIIDSDSQPVDVSLAFCTLAVVCTQPVSYRQALIHLAPLQFNGLMPGQMMDSVLHAPVLQYYGLDDRSEPVSFMQAVERYREQTQASQLGMYVISGSRLTSSDLFIARYGLTNQAMSLLGAELNQCVKLRIQGRDQSIAFFPPVQGSEYLRYVIGKRYAFNLRP